MIEGDVTEAKMAEHGAAPDGGDEIGAMPWDSHILEVDELTALIVTLAKPDQPLEELTTVVQRTGTIVSTLWEGTGSGRPPHTVKGGGVAGGVAACRPRLHPLALLLLFLFLVLLYARPVP